MCVPGLEFVKSGQRAQLEVSSLKRSGAVRADGGLAGRGAGGWRGVVVVAITIAVETFRGPGQTNSKPSQPLTQTGQLGPRT